MKKRKFYLVLPLLALPFITLAFWAMGGGSEKAGDVKTTAGLNLQLPDAKLKDERNFDKLSFYDQADKDSLHHTAAPDTGMNVLEMIPKQQNKSGLISSPFSNNGVDNNEQKIYKKINELNRQINTPAENKDQNIPVQNNNNEQFSRQVDKLQNLMQTMNDKQDADPEMQQLGGMLDKIMAIQHPEKIKEISIKNKDKVFAVQPLKNEVTLLQSKYTDTIKMHNKFFDDNNTSAETVDHVIQAVVHETQTVVSGSTIKLRLTDAVYINGILIPEGNFIYGTASLENERLSVTINAVRYQNNLLPVSLEVYDLDGIAGIHIPGSISRDVAKQSSEQGLQNIDLTTLDPSIAAQAANTGLQAARNLLSRKMKVIKVTLKAGYKVLLNNKN